MPGTARFAAASQAMANSPTVPPKVRPIFKRFIAAIDATKPCVAKGDYECIIRNSQEVGLGGMEEGAKLSQGPLKQLFEKLIKTDEMALTAASNFSKDDVQLVIQLSDIVLGYKASLMEDYLNKYN